MSITPAAGWKISPTNPNQVVRDTSAFNAGGQAPVPATPTGMGSIQGTLPTSTTPNVAGNQAAAAKLGVSIPGATTQAAPIKTAASSSTSTQTPAPTGAGLDPSSFMNVLNGLKQKFAGDNDLINAKNLLIKGLFTSPLTPDQIAQLPPDMQQVYNSGNKDAIQLQIQALNERIQGGTNNLASSVNYLVSGYKSSVDQAEQQKQDATETLFKIAQNFVDPKTGTVDLNKMGAALHSMYPNVDTSGIISQLEGLTPTSTYNATTRDSGLSGPSSYQEWSLAGGQAGTGKSYAEFLADGNVKAPTTAQQTVGTYAARLEQSNPIITNLEKDLTDMNIANFEIQRKLPSYAQSDTYQQFDQASRNFINAVLRRESGAVISPSEFDNAFLQYLPRPGDSEDTLKQKRENRQIVEASFKKAAGPAYESVADLLGPSGTVATGILTSPDGKQEVNAADLTPAELKDAQTAGWK